MDREKRMKKMAAKRPRRGEPSRRSPSPPEILPRFISPSAESTFHRFSEHAQTLPARHFVPFIQPYPNVIPLLESTGLLDFLKIKEPVIPSLVKEFYSNWSWTSVDGALAFTTRLCGIKIFLDEHKFCELFHLPELDDIQLDIYVDSIDTHMSIKLDTLFSQATSSGSKRSQSRFDLKPGLDLIAFLFGYCIRPKSGSRDVVEEYAIDPLYAIATGLPIRWGAYIISHMSNISDHATRLPYGNLITRIAKKFRVPTTNNRSISSSAIDSSSFAKMKQVVVEPPEPENPDLSGDSEDDHEPPTGAGPSTLPIDRVSERLDHLEIQVSGIGEALGAFRQHVDTRFDNLDASFQRLWDHFAPPPPPPPADD